MQGTEAIIWSILHHKGFKRTLTFACVQRTAKLYPTYEWNFLHYKYKLLVL